MATIFTLIAIVDLNQIGAQVHVVALLPDEVDRMEVVNGILDIDLQVIVSAGAVLPDRCGRNGIQQQRSGDGFAQAMRSGSDRDLRESPHPENATPAPVTGSDQRVPEVHPEKDGSTQSMASLQMSFHTAGLLEQSVPQSRL